MSLAVRPSPLATFHLPVEILRGVDGVRGLSCPSCGLALDLHQPDTDDPDFLLGSCPACGAWHLIGTGPPQLGVVIMRLPDGEAIRAALKPGA